MEKSEIEYKEKHYLDKMCFDLLVEKDKMIDGILTKEDIRKDWEGIRKKGISDSSTGIERIFYWLFNQLGRPNSCPVGSNLIFETYDAYIHIDVKSIQTDNIGDFKNIFVEDNQNSYIGEFKISGKNSRKETYKGNLPTFYTKKSKEKKITLTYFITTLHDNSTGQIVIIYITCMPNGQLKYENILSAGKNPGKIRFKYLEATFKNLKNEKRTKIIYLNREYINRKKWYKKLKKCIDLYEAQNIN